MPPTQNILLDILPVQKYKLDRLRDDGPQRSRVNGWERHTMLPSRFVSFLTERRRQCRAVACAVLFLACLFRYRQAYDPVDTILPKTEVSRIASNLSETGEFANPFAALKTGPSAHLAPAFPIFMALVIHTFGDKAVGAFVLRSLGALVLATQISLFPFFSRRLGMGELNGIVAACVWIVAKPAFNFNSEAYYAALLMAATCCLFRRYLEKTDQYSGGLSWILGGLFGFLILLIPTAVPILAAWLGWVIWRRKFEFVKTAFLPLVLLPAVIISPWIIRNYLVFHRLILRDNFGLELSVSNNDCAQFSLRKNMDSTCTDIQHPYENATLAGKVLEMGEAQYSALRLRDALQWIAGHPARFVKLTGMRFIAFWFPTESGSIHYAGSGRRLERVVIYLMTLLSLEGLMILCRLDVKSAAICISCLMLFPLIYYIIQFIDRYRDPIMWMTFLLGAVPITRYLGSKLIPNYDR